MKPFTNELQREFTNTTFLLNNTNKTLKEIYYLIYKRNKNSTSTVYFNDEGHLKSYSYTVFHNNVTKYAAYISRKLEGFEKDSVVIIKFSNCKDWPEIFWATLMSGFVPLLVDANTSLEGVENLAKQSKAVGIITNDLKKFSLKKVKVDNIIYNSKRNPKLVERWANEIIFCSSGTTGDVKMMVYDGEAISNQIIAASNIPDLATDLNIIYPRKYGPIRNLAMIPFHHVFGMMVLLFWYQWFGGALVYPINNTPSELLKACQLGKVTHVLSVPLLWNSVATSVKRKINNLDGLKKTILENVISYNLGKISEKEAGISSKKFVQNKIKKDILGKHIRFCISGGGAMTTETLEIINGLGYPLHNGYGMTEIGIAAVNLSSNIESKLDCNIGKPFFGFEFKIDPSKEDASMGELLVKSTTMHKRALIGGVESKSIVDDEGYFHTGDIVSCGKDGNYFIKGRSKDIIINSDGENIFPDELELYFLSLKHVIHFTVLGIKKSKNEAQEEVCLVLEVENSTTQKDLDELEKVVKNTKLPHNVKIESIYLAKCKLPIANNMKIKRFQVKKAIESGSDCYFKLGSKIIEKKEITFTQEQNLNIIEPLKKIFAKVLILPEFKISNSSHWVNDLGGDSMNYMEMINMVQEKFDLIFEQSLLGQMASLGDIAQEIIRNQKEK